jgi:hypothetical protein
LAKQDRESKEKHHHDSNWYSSLQSPIKDGPGDKWRGVVDIVGLSLRDVRRFSFRMLQNW